MIFGARNIYKNIKTQKTIHHSILSTLNFGVQMRKHSSYSGTSSYYKRENQERNLDVV